MSMVLADQEACAHIHRAPLLALNHGNLVGRLPPEIWVQIFLYSLNNGYRWFDRIQSLTTITSTCDGWRSIAINCVVLWTSIKYVSAPRGDIYEVHYKRLEQVSSYLSRSRGAEIDVEIIYHSSNTSNFTQVVNAILPYTSRCRSFQLVCSYEDITNIIIPLPDPMPVLRRLEIHFKSPNGKLMGASCALRIESLNIYSYSYCYRSITAYAGPV